MTNLIVGIATGYNWNALEPFVVSLRRHYKGKCVLIIDERADEALYAKFREYNISTFKLEGSEEHPIVARFSVIADLIDSMPDLDYVVCVDTKDIVFQSDPVAWLEANLGDKELAVVSEGSLYQNNIGNARNAKVAFGEDVYKTLAQEEVCNAGVIAGRPHIISRLSRDIYSLCAIDLRLVEFKPTYEDMLPDQTAMNILLRQSPYDHKVLILQAEDGFVFEGVFDKVHLQQDKSFYKDGTIRPKKSLKPFVIFHQYFAWQPEVRELYSESHQA